MKDFQDLIEPGKHDKDKAKQNAQELLEQFESIQREMMDSIQNKQATTSKEEQDIDDYDDELQDQMAESLFQEAN